MPTAAWTWRNVGTKRLQGASVANVQGVRDVRARCKAEPSSPPPAEVAAAPEADKGKAALLARIAKAKSYQKAGDTTSSAPATPLPAAPPPVMGPRAPVDWGAVESFIGSGGKTNDQPDSGPPLASTPRTAEQLRADQEAEEQRRMRFAASKDKSDEPTPMDQDTPAFTSMLLNATQAPGRGSATQAAGFLQSVLNQEAAPGDLDASTMRMEEFTNAKERRTRAMGAEILTIDSSYSARGDKDGSITATTRNTDAAAQFKQVLQASRLTGEVVEQPITQEEKDQYQPKVSTWGVFPRPSNISKEYGGGRELKPGQELETPEQKAAREASYEEALKAYRAKAGLEVDPELEVEAEALYEAGMVLFKAADLQGAYDKFAAATALVPIKTRVGGLAGLQQAIILDSQGYPEEAKKIYKRLRGHAVATVARKSKQLLFGFEASTFLKADQFSYAPKSGDFDRYFRPVIDRTTVWVPTEAEREEDERSARLASLIAVLVLVGPVAIMGALITQFGH